MSHATNTHPHPDVPPGDDDLAELLPRLNDEDGVVRRLALTALAELEDDAHAPWLAWALSDADAGVRAEAAARLAYWEQPETVQALAGALSDEDEAVRKAAAHSLAELKQADSGLLLLPHLASADEAFVKASILRALRELRLPDSYVPALHAIDAPQPEVRLEAVGVLGWLKREEALPALTRVVSTDPSADVRRAAAGALGLASGDAGLQPAVLDALKGALADAVWAVREEAATTLGKLKQAGSADALIHALQDDYWQVRQKSARALGRLRAGSAVEPLVAHALTHSSANLRKEAAIALGEIGDRAAVPALTLASQDADPDVRKLARLALTQLGA